MRTKHYSFFYSVIILVLTLTFSTSSTAHTNHLTKEDTIVPGRMLSFKDTLYANFRGGRQLYITHVMKRGQTLNGLEKYYAVSVGDLVYYNPDIKDIYAIPVGKGVRIPIQVSHIMREDNEITQVRWKVIPIMYQVKQGETLYRVSKTYFGMPIDMIKKRNNLTSDVLKKGQVLHIGWLNVKGIQPSERKYSGLKGELRVVNSNLKKKFDADAKNTRKREKIQKGTAIWKKSSSRDTKLYALHRTVPIGTVIKVYCPSTKRTLHVKVMGKMSDDVYRDDYIIYLSPAAATSLGAVNAKLRVELTYYQ